MAKRKRRKSSRQTPIRVRLFIAGLIVIVIAGIGAVKYLESPRGKVFLLDAGFPDYYGEVQDTLDVVLHNASRELGLSRHLRVQSRHVAVKDRRFVSRRWYTTCPDACSLVQINLAFTQAIQSAGGVVRSSRELDDGNALVLDAGSKKYTTHRIKIRQRAEPPQSTTGPSKESQVSHPRGGRSRPKLALVIDDFGYSRDKTAQGFFSIDLPLTLSVIPTLPHSKYCVARAGETGKQAILHLPMEAGEGENGSDVPAVLVTMSAAEIASMVDTYLNDMPAVVGVNNHQGSVATQDVRVMTVVLGVIEARELFFFDSLTSSESIAYNTARQLGVPTARNDIFLDADTNEQEVVEQRLERLLEIARDRGFAIGIGHPKRWTLDALRSYEKTLKYSDVEVVFLATLVD
ncbi:MAG: divergent polysaccharide deacetylase family protein [Candidatus Latescibacterota bacterium]|nr:MAG: divergent polysaccharide deacetylase family protein [Candidatus Latescibacterota bacterium]